MKVEQYLVTGEEVVVVRQLDEGFLVQRVLDTGEGAELGDVEYVGKVYDRAPTDRIDPYLVKARLELETLREERRRLEQEIAAIKAQEAPRLERYKMHHSLRHLDRFLTQPPTHYVMQQYSEILILTSAEVQDNERDTWERGVPASKVRLLSLYGKTNGDLEWQLNRYRDGSGGWTEVIPCISLEEARAEAQARFDKLLNEDGANLRLVASGEKLGLTVPDSYRAAALERQRAAKAQEVEHARDSLIKLVGELARLERGDTEGLTAPIPCAPQVG